MIMPTSARWMTDAEWEIVTGVYNSSNLPFKVRIFVTNGLGAYDAPFTIPTSLISTVGMTAGLGVLGGPAGAALGAAVGSLASIVNAAYLMNVGQSNYDTGSDGKGMATGDKKRELLVHETAHVWQGKNNTLALSYVYASALHQCKGIIGGGSRNAAYNATPGAAWGSYNPEQQASLIEKWFKDGEHGSGDIWPYIRDYVRKGKTS
jgi:hypothetical protein